MVVPNVICRSNALFVGIIALADGIKNNGALVSANLVNNNIGAEQVQNLVAILKEHASLKSLCGNKGDETVLDMSGKNMDADGAIMLAPEIVANGALASLDLSQNSVFESETGPIKAICQSKRIALKI